MKNNLAYWKRKLAMLDRALLEHMPLWRRAKDIWEAEQHFRESLLTWRSNLAFRAEKAAKDSAKRKSRPRRSRA